MDPSPQLLPTHTASKEAEKSQTKEQPGVALYPVCQPVTVAPGPSFPAVTPCPCCRTSHLGWVPAAAPAEQDDLDSMILKGLFQPKWF